MIIFAENTFLVFFYNRCKSTILIHWCARPCVCVCEMEGVCNVPQFLTDASITHSARRMVGYIVQRFQESCLVALRVSERGFLLHVQTLGARMTSMCASELAHVHACLDANLCIGIV